MSTHQQPPSQPEVPADFPGLDLEAWDKALPMPSPYPADAIARKPAQPRSEPPPFTLSPIEKRGIRRRKEKP
jgi:hypothetical protein